MNDINIYRLTAKELPGYIYISFENGMLRTIHNELRGEVPSGLFQTALQIIPQFERSIFPTYVGFTIEPIPGKTVKEKIILFGAAHLHYRKTSCSPSKIERANIKNVPVTENLLKVFFESRQWWNANNNFTLSNYISRIAILKDIAKNGLESAPAKSKYPNQYEAAFEAKCSPDDLTGYWAHLRSLGFKSIKKDGKTVWTK